MDVSWVGATVVITGGSGAVGSAVARATSRLGARVGLIARRERPLVATSASLCTPSAHAVADVSDEPALCSALEQLRERLGEIDVLVTAADLGSHRAFLEEDPATVDRLLRVNFLGATNAIRAVLPPMVERRHGHIVTVGAMAGRVGAPYQAAFSASKFALVGFTEALAAEVRPFGVHVGVVNPGPLEVDGMGRRPAGRRQALAPEHVAQAVVRAVAKRRSEQIVPSHLLVKGLARVASPRYWRWDTDRDFAAEWSALETRIDLDRP